MTEQDDFSDIDTLMAQDPLGLSNQDLDRIIAYQRKMRVQREQGVRTKKPSASAPSKLDISSLLAGPAAGPKVQRRF